MILEPIKKNNIEYIKLPIGDKFKTSKYQI